MSAKKAGKDPKGNGECKKPAIVGLGPVKKETPKAPESALEVQGTTDMDRALKACEYITEGNGVREACRRVDMDKGKFFRMLAGEGADELANRYARARVARADARVESADEVIGDLKAGLIDAQTARVILDDIKWRASRENQARYGDKIEVDNKGEVVVKHKWGA